jgi:hypothetical protein
LDSTVKLGPDRAAWIGRALRGGDRGGDNDAGSESAARILRTMFPGRDRRVATGRDADEVAGILDDAARRLLP